MKKPFSPRSLALSIIAISLLAIIIIITTTSSKASSPLGTRLSGKILLQVEDHGKAWYVSADNDNQRIYLGSPAEAHCLMKTLGLGISNNDLNRYLNDNDNNFPTRLSGKILLAVEQHGEAYYINPDNLKGYYLGRPIDALKLMRELSLGITNTNLNTIPVLDNTEMLKKCNITKTEEQQENTETNISLVTNPVAPMTNFSHIVSISATLTNPDNISIKERGLLYDFTIFPNTNLTPTLDKYNQKLISNISSNNNYTINISNLTPGSYPFIRSYAITGDNQIIYGNTINISSTNNAYLPYIPNSSSATNSTAPLEEIPVWTECGDIYYDNRDGNTYNTVVIGDQCWFQENLEETKYIDGSSIPNLITNEQMMEATTGGYCWYKNDPDTYGAYGALYNWNTVVDAKGLCPSGWHIPGDNEWIKLSNFLGGASLAGEKLKASSTDSIPWNGTNSSGFTALPVGFRILDGYFSRFQNIAHFWSSSNNIAYTLENWNSNINRIDDANPVLGYSVRCLKNQAYTVTYTAGIGGVLIGSTTQTIAYSEDGTEVEATPNDGYEFVKWSDGLTTNPRVDSNIIDNIEISAIFAVPCSSEIVCGQSCSYEGEIYNTVTINDQCWFKDNLNIGIQINGTNDQTNNPTIEKYCYNNNSANCNIYGGLYQWNELMNYSTSTTQGICPTGWHVPSDDEWTTLITYLGGDSGYKLKASSWGDGSNNSSGFTALPAGNRLVGGGFGNLGGFAFFWSSSERRPGDSWLRYLVSGDSGVYRHNDNQTVGYSVRCLKN